MKRFQFRLDSILRFREIEQDKALDNYARSIQFRQMVQNRCEQALSKLEDLYETMRSTRGDAFTVAQQSTLHSFSSNIIDHIQREQAALAQARDAENQALQAYFETKKRVDILIKLKDNKLRTHTHEGLKQEEKKLEALIYNRNNPLNSLG